MNSAEPETCVQVACAELSICGFFFCTPQLTHKNNPLWQKLPIVQYIDWVHVFTITVHAHPINHKQQLLLWSMPLWITKTPHNTIQEDLLVLDWLSIGCPIALLRVPIAISIGHAHITMGVRRQLGPTPTLTALPTHPEHWMHRLTKLTPLPAWGSEKGDYTSQCT